MDDQRSPQWDEPDDRADGHGNTWRFVRLHGPAVAGLLAALVTVVVAGPPLASRIGDGLQHEPAAAPIDAVVTTTTPTITMGEPVTAPPIVPAPTAPTTTGPPASPGAPAASPAAPAPPATDPVVRSAVTTLQTVPPVRDVIIEVGDRQVATDATGAVALTADEAGATVRVVGTVADPPVQAVSFAMWGDGALEPTRALDTVEGPVAQIGLVVRSRVVVAADDTAAAGTTASFTTGVGPIDLTLGVPTWVPAVLAVPSAGGLAPMDVGYSLVGRSDGATVGGRDFRPTPEATWRITT